MAQEIVDQVVARIQAGEPISDRETEIIDPAALAPIIIDHHTNEGIGLIGRLLKEVRLQGVSDRQFLITAGELMNLRTRTENIPPTESALVDAVTGNVLDKTQGIPEEDVRDLVTATPIAGDWVRFVGRVREHSESPQQIEGESRWVLNRATRRLTKLVGPEAYRLLTTSRLIGLVPLAATDRLRNIRIRNAGASAIAKTLFLVAEMGAEDIEFWDAGKFDGPDITRQVGGVASYENIGSPKAPALQAAMQVVNPYAHFRGYPGRVIPERDKSSERFDITFEEFVRDADFLGEAVDAAHIKAAFRLYLSENHPNSPLLFLADVSDAFAGIELAANKDQYFNQSLTGGDLQRMAARPQEKLRSVVAMLGNNFPPEHQLQFIYVATGKMPFWSQMPLSANESSAVATRLILNWSMGRDYSGENFTTRTVSRSLMPALTQRQVVTLERVMTQLFDITKAKQPSLSDDS